MINNVTTIAVTALLVTAVGIALRPGAPTARVVGSTLGGFAKVQRASFGPN